MSSDGVSRNRDNPLYRAQEQFVKAVNRPNNECIKKLSRETACCTIPASRAIDGYNEGECQVLTNPALVLYHT